MALASWKRAVGDEAATPNPGATPLASLASTLNAPQREALRKAGLVFDDRTAPEKIRDGLGETLKLFSSDTLKRAEERSEEHTSELQSLMRISYAVCCL